MRLRRCRWCLPTVLALAVGCPASPEDGRRRGGGAGADGGNYRAKPVAVPSKLDGTKAMAPALPRP
jgi:hypothetical protein